MSIHRPFFTTELAKAPLDSLSIIYTNTNDSRLDGKFHSDIRFSSSSQPAESSYIFFSATVPFTQSLSFRSFQATVSPFATDHDKLFMGNFFSFLVALPRLKVSYIYCICSVSLMLLIIQTEKCEGIEDGFFREGSRKELSEMTKHHSTKLWC